MIDISDYQTTEECLFAANEWLSTAGRSAEDVIELVGKMFAKTNESIEIVSSALAIIFNGQGDVLLLHRRPDSRSFPDRLSFPGGQIELADKDLEETVVREAKQETGLAVEPVRHHSTRFTPDPKRKRIYHIAFFELNISDDSPDVVLSDEHSSYVWATPKAVLEEPEKYPLAGHIILQDILKGYLDS